VAGYSTNVDGVYGHTNSRYGIGVSGYSSMWMGVAGSSSDGYGVYGDSSRGPGVHGHSSNSWGVVGESDSSHGMYGRSTNGYGVYGLSNSRIDVRGDSSSGWGVYGGSYEGYGVYGYSDRRIGVYGGSPSGYGVYGWSRDGYAMYGRSDGGYAAYLEGRVAILGPLQKPAGSFKIDHPLDPANKYLSHSFVESPDMKNVYDGVVVLDDKGEAEIELPDWFGALNKDFRYQLTDEEEEANIIIVSLKLPNKRAYELAWSICLLKGYQNLDEFVSDVFLDRIEMYPDGRADIHDLLHWGYKTREEMREEEKEQQERDKHKEKEETYRH
jgi:hypothetical protein